MAEITAMRLEDWLDDLCVRFIINLPREELESVERICFQVEEAQWFYEDFIRPLDPNLPSMSLRQFALRIFQHCPLMSEWSHHHHTVAFSEFLAYKTRVPVRGAILLNQAMDEVVLVKGWKKSAHWSFPRGKINKDEKDLDCAVREVHEETGFDIKAAGLVDEEENLKYIEIPMREQNMRLYVVRGVPRDAYFEPRTRKEISKIEWYKLSELPTLKKSKQVSLQPQNTNGNANKFYMVAPFLGPLKKWIAYQRKLDLAKEQPPLAANIIHAEDASQGREPDGYATQHTSELQLPSDLPEVSTLVPHQGEPSAHMKRLLNIDTEARLSQEPSDSSKADTLLSLLREGSEGLSSKPPGIDGPGAVSSQPDSRPSQPLPPPLPWQGNTPVPHYPATLQPSPFAFPRDQSYLAEVRRPGVPANNLSHAYQFGIEHRPLQPPPGPYPEPRMHEQRRFQPSYTQNPLQNVAPPSITSQPHYAGRQAPGFGFTYPNIENKRAPAPYQLTGDPQFAQGSRFPNTELSSGPPANKLPMPKLTSRSRALLNVFKSDSTKKQEPAAPELPSQPVSQKQPDSGDKTQHQDNLLKLLQQQQQYPSPSPAPTAKAEIQQAQAELATTTSPLPDTSKPESVRVLKRENTAPSSQLTPHGTYPHRATDATLSGPLNLPNFEAAKSSRKQAAQSVKNVQKESKKDKPANITILPRPHQAKRDSPSTAPAANAGHEAQSSPPAPNVKLADFAKPSQPKILRRPEKGNLDACLPTHTVAVSAFSKPENEEAPSEHKDEPRQPNYDRRPSQPAAQKEALLSLFSKSAGGPSTSVTYSPEQQRKPPVSPPPTSPTRSNVISPLASGSPPYSGATSQPQASHPPANTPAPVATGESATKDRSKATTSAGDKAFLLGYLAGVAKGDR